MARQTLWGFGGCECEYNCCDMARTLRTGENAFRRSCNFRELGVVKKHILQLVRYAPDGSLCTASVEQIFPRDGVQRNCFELAIYIMTASPIASVRVFETALPTLSVRDRGIIVLNHRPFWGYASGPSSSGNTLPSSIHGHAARRNALPHERCPLTPTGHSAAPLVLLVRFRF